MSVKSQTKSVAIGMSTEVVGGSVHWTDPQNITASDDLRAVAQGITAGGSTHRLDGRMQGNNFSIPSWARILGIVVKYEKSVPSASAGWIFTHSARLLKNGIPVGENKASSDPNAWPTAEGIFQAGGATDLWGATWTPTEINSDGFGASIRARNDDPTNTRTARVDHIEITVYYDDTYEGAIDIQAFGDTTVQAAKIAIGLLAMPATGVVKARGWRVLKNPAKTVHEARMWVEIR